MQNARHGLSSVVLARDLYNLVCEKNRRTRSRQKGVLLYDTRRPVQQATESSQFVMWNTRLVGFSAFPPTCIRILRAQFGRYHASPIVTCPPRPTLCVCLASCPPRAGFLPLARTPFPRLGIAGLYSIDCTQPAAETMELISYEVGCVFSADDNACGGRKWQHDHTVDTKSRTAQRR